MNKLAMAFVILLAAGNTLFAQDEMEMIEDIARLQFQLKSVQIPERDAAEKELIAMGEMVLDHLEETKSDDSSDYKERVLRVRTTLEKVAVAKNTQPSRMKVEAGKISMEDLLKQIKKQTGNDVILGREVLLETSNKEIEFEKTEQLEFWNVLSQLMDQTGLQIDPYDGEPGQLALSESIVRPGQESVKPVVLTDYSGVMRFQITRIDSTKNLLLPNVSSSRFNLLVRWEPRITPIAIDFPFSSVELVDEFDQKVASEQEGVYSGIVTPGIPQLEFLVSTSLIDRQVEQIKSLKGEVEAVLPGRVETFKFQNVTETEEDTFQIKAGAKVTFGGIIKNEDLWGLRLSLSFDEENNALESHQAWVYNNEIYLVDEDGKKYPPIGSETFQQTNDQVGILYYFGDDPKDMDLHYKTPAAVVKVKIPFVITEIPLP